jgi:hypothetical protein
MNKFLIILLLSILIFENSCGQIKKEKQGNLITKTIELKEKFQNDSDFLKKLKKRNSDSVLINFDYVENDTTSYLREFSSSSHKIKFPIRPIGWTSDYENIFTKTQVEYLDSIISAYEQKTSNEIAVLTIDSSLIDKDKFDEKALEIFKDWGIGKKRKK